MRACKGPGCTNTFVPCRGWQVYCSSSCRYARHYVDGGWYVRAKYKLGLRIESNQQRLEAWSLDAS